MHKILIFPILLALLSACSTIFTKTTPKPTFSGTSPMVTIETSGDLYPSDDESQIQIDFFGRCAKDNSNIVIEVKKNQKVVACNNSQYKYSHFFPKKIYRSRSKAHHLTRIKVYHRGELDKGAQSWVLLDLKRQLVKTILNRQIRYEKIPTGELEPVTEFNAFGSCNDGNNVKIDITGLDRYGHRVSRYDDSKSCKNSGFYFLSQIDGVALRGMRFHISEKGDPPAAETGRGLASAKGSTGGFQWSIPMN